MLADVSVARFGQNHYRVTVFKRALPDGEYHSPRHVVTESSGRFACNLSRARSTIMELCLCNPWEMFGTFTLDKSLRDREDLSAFKKTFTQWIRNYNRYHECCIKYLLVPEQHRDGAWHMHGVFMGVPDGALTDFVVGVHPKRLTDNGYKNWQAYADKFGFCSFDCIKNIEACARYISDYVRKSMDAQTAVPNGKNLYMCSQKLARREAVFSGWANVSSNKFFDECYENDFLFSKLLDADAVCVSGLSELVPTLVLN